MHPVRECFLDHGKGAAVAAHLRGIAWIDRYYSHASFFRFACEDITELRPARVVYRLRKAGFGDALDVESLVSYQTIIAYEFPSLLMVEVSALVRRLLVQPRNALAGLAAATRALLFPEKRTLRPAQFLLGVPVVARGLYKLAFGGGKEALQPEVYANLRTSLGGFGSFTGIRGEDHVPFAAEPPDAYGLDLSLHRPMQFDFDVSDVLKVKSSVVLDAASVAVGRELYESEAITAFEARIARGRPDLHTAEERFKSAIQSSEGSLRAGKVRSRKVRVGLARFFELAGLPAVRDRAPFGFAGIPALLQSRVIESAVCLKHYLKGFGLGAVRIKPEFEGFSHVRSIRSK